MAEINQNQLDAAGPLINIIVERTGRDRLVDPAIAISTAALMAGSFLLRSFDLELDRMEPGTAILSEQADRRGPILINVLATVLEHIGVEIEDNKLQSAGDAMAGPALSLLEAQEQVEPEMFATANEYGLSLERLAQACAIAVAFLIRDCAGKLDPHTGFKLAAYGFVEGVKTVPEEI